MLGGQEIGKFWSKGKAEIVKEKLGKVKECEDDEIMATIINGVKKLRKRETNELNHQFIKNRSVCVIRLNSGEIELDRTVGGGVRFQEDFRKSKEPVRPSLNK